MRRQGSIAVLLLTACAAHAPSSGPEPACPVVEPARAVQAPPPAVEKPRLVVWLTIDQLRGDSFSRFAHLVSKDGFGRLLDGGSYFSLATYAHALTETAPGHATLFTGASPRDHGIISNEWFDGAGKLTTSVADPARPLVGPELDPSETGPAAGRSPMQLLLPTLGDALRQVTVGQARVVAVSVKDRGAILPAGRSGKAFWLGKKGFVTSQYYDSEVPKILLDNQRTHPPSSYLADGWSLSLDERRYRTSQRHKGDFPHRAEAATPAYTWLKTTPFGDVATIDLAEHLVRSFELGADDVVDLLSVSLSSTDYVGHIHGPESREAEDNFARLDRLLARFFAFFAEQVGRGRVLYVLSADHGIAEIPESQLAAGLPSGRVDPKDLEAAARRSLTEQLGSDRFVLGVSRPEVFLDRPAIARTGKDLRIVRERLAADLERLPGVYRAFSLGEARDGSEVGQRVWETTHDSRSGDVYVVLSPHMQFTDEEFRTSHGSPWFSDRHVPIVLAGPGVPQGTFRGPVDVRALAGTVADLLGIPAPAGSHGARLLSASSAVQPGD